MGHSLLPEIVMILLIQWTAVLHKYFDDEQKTCCSLQSVPDVAQNSWLFLVQRNLSVFQVCGQPNYSLSSSGNSAKTTGPFMTWEWRVRSRQISYRTEAGTPSKSWRRRRRHGFCRWTVPITMNRRRPWPVRPRHRPADHHRTRNSKKLKLRGNTLKCSTSVELTQHNQVSLSLQSSDRKTFYNEKQGSVFEAGGEWGYGCRPLPSQPFGLGKRQKLPSKLASSRDLAHFEQSLKESTWWQDMCYFWCSAKE